MERHSKDKHIMQYNAIQAKDNKNNRKAFSMMQYHIEGYAYDVTNNVTKDDVIMMSYESGRVQSMKKCNMTPPTSPSLGHGTIVQSPLGPA